VNPEAIDAWQIGVKSEWLQDRLRLNATGFAYRYRNIQVDQLVAGATVLVNAADARMRGFDVEAEYRASNYASLHAGVAFLRGRYEDFRTAPITTPARNAAGDLTGGNSLTPGDASGHDTVRSPNVSASLEARLRLPVSVGDLGLNVGYAYNSGFAWDPDNRLKQPAYHLLNASVAWRLPGDRFTVRVAGSNLTGEETCAYASATPLGDICSPRAPRLLSIELSTRF
jgi:iron complex outermembrane receptor protein